MADPVPCAGAIVFDADGRLLLVRRGNAPLIGHWCEPSGRCEPGETAAEACVRETREETGLEVRVLRRLGSVIVPGVDDRDVEIAEFECALLGGTLRAGDDADDARWVTRAELDALPLVPLLTELLAGWDCLPRC